jgi:hypothetical protein
MEFIYPARYLDATPRLLSREESCSRKEFPMLDIAYLVVGALFLGVCALYALACDAL